MTFSFQMTFVITSYSIHYTKLYDALTRQNGVYVKSGDPTRRYLGTVRTTATTGTSANTENKRFIYNYYNKLPFAVKTANSNASWTYTTAAWREYNGGTGQTRAEFRNNFV